MLYILLALAALIAVLLLRTLAFAPKPVETDASPAPDFDKDKAVDNLRQLVRCKTVSSHDRSKEDDREFRKLLDLLPELFPTVCKNCPPMLLPDRGLLFRWAGKSDQNPAVLMAHYDVVPADPAGWEVDPFEGVIRDGALWGRGTLDTKVTFSGVLTAAEHLMTQGFTPERDIYFAFSGGEEVGGPGAVHIVDWFMEHKVDPALVVDEGGAVVEGVFPGLSIPCGLIGTAEKGIMNVTFTAKSAGGHASAPPKETPLTRLSTLCRRATDKPFDLHIAGPAGQMFDVLGRSCSFPFRMIFANLWLFKPVLDLLARSKGGELNALMRTTVAFTQATGSPSPNVIPPVATMTANLRLNPADSVASAAKRLEQLAEGLDLELEINGASEPSRVSTIDCDGYRRVAAAVGATWPGALVSPYLMIQASDSRRYGVLTDKVYRFSAMDLTAAERKLIHGHNERIRLETVHRSVEFFIRLMKQC